MLEKDPLIKTAGFLGFFSWCEHPRKMVPYLYHLLFAGDAIFIGYWSVINYLNLSWILRCFILPRPINPSAKPFPLREISHVKPVTPPSCEGQCFTPWGGVVGPHSPLTPSIPFSSQWSSSQVVEVRSLRLYKVSFPWWENKDELICRWSLLRLYKVSFFSGLPHCSCPEPTLLRSFG